MACWKGGWKVSGALNRVSDAKLVYGAVPSRDRLNIDRRIISVANKISNLPEQHFWI